MQTYQDLEQVGKNEASRMQFVFDAIDKHKSSAKYNMALTAERYYRQDTDINRYQKFVTNVLGQKIPDIWSANNRIPSNWHFYFVTQAVQFLLGNGVQFTNDKTLEKLGKDWQVKMQDAAIKAKNTSCAFGFWNLDHMDVFSLSEFVPLYDEDNGLLKAGIRFWQIDPEKPLMATLYEMDGYTEYKKPAQGNTVVLAKKRAYKQTFKTSIADGKQLVAGENYTGFPIVPLHNVNDQSDLVGNKETIDGVDHLTSQLVNGATQADFIYWVFKNCGGMQSQEELQQAIEQLYTSHAVSIDETSEMTPHQLTMPHEGAMATREMLIDQLYHDYMGLKVTDIAAGAVTATQISAAYEPLLQKTSMFEQQVRKFISGILELAGIDDEPTFTRMTIANKAEDVQTLMLADTYFDDDTMVNQLCALFGFPEKAQEILRLRDAEETQRFETEEEPKEEQE